MKNLEETERKDLILTRKGAARNLRGHKKILHKGICLKNTKMYSFPQRSIDTWNGLKEEVIMAMNAHQLKEKLDKSRYRTKYRKNTDRPLQQQ